MEKRPPQELIPLQAFLHRIRPPSAYPESGALLAHQRIFQPRPKSRAVHLRVPVDWEATDTPDRNWRMQLQAWAMFHPIMNVFDSLSEKGVALDYFFEIMADWWGSYATDPNDIVTARTPDSYAWYDMSVGYRALALAFFGNRLDHYGFTIAPNLRKLLIAVVTKHVDHLSNPRVFYPNNHGIFQIHGLMALAQVYMPERFDSISSYAQRRMSELLGRQFDERGLHVEHSPQYHFFALETFRAVYRTGWYNDPLADARLRRAEEACKWLVDPSKHISAIGDSNPTRMDLDFPGSQKEAGLVASPFDASGFAIVRSSWDRPANESTYLILIGAYNSKVHKHRDCLSFEWYANGCKRITDMGKYGYHADEWRKLALSSAAHSTVEIEGFDILRLKPYGSAIDSVFAMGGVAQIQASLRFKAVTHRRFIVVSEHGWLLIRDCLRFNRPREIIQWFQIGPEHILRTITKGRASFEGPDGSVLFVEALSGFVDSAAYFGDRSSLRGFVSPNDDTVEPNWAIGFASHAKELVADALLAVGADARQEAMASYGDGLLDSLASQPRGS